jgi:23S rRNA U2552 (ribose-2'-O)-methylase RlmE/FtsJ
MMQQIGDELQRSTGALRQTPEEGVKILDLCMAPRGYTASALKYNPGATAFGITLPPAQGGHEILFESSQSSVILLDVTMLVKEFGTENPPRTHPEYASFIHERPYIRHTFDLVFCDGQVLRQHQRLGYRENKEPLRLTVSQLILALQRIRRGGTLIMLLHKVEAWDTLELLYDFSRFSSIHAFKPKKKHAIRSSFYLIAKNVQPDSDVARVSVEEWKIAWQRATFGGNCEADEGVVAGSAHVKSVLDQFGNEYVKLGRPIWEIQAEALSKMDFTK